MVLLVDLDTQKGEPTTHEALRVVGNLVHAGRRAGAARRWWPAGRHRQPRVRMVFTDVAEGLSLPQWTLDEDATQPARPWRYPEPGEG